MSSPLFPAQIPLPPVHADAAPVPVTGSQPLPYVAPVTLTDTSAAACDPSTLAYYNAYYAQYQQYMAAVAAGTATTHWPATATVTTPHAAGYVLPAVQPTAAWPVVGQQQVVGAAVVPAAAQDEGVSDGEDETVERAEQKKNILPVYGNEKTMNLNSLILTNIQQSNYFKNSLYPIKTLNELLDEIWEQVGGQTGMCGSVRGVGAGGIISTAFCCLYKLKTLKPTRKQMMHMIKFRDAPYIRAIGFLYIRYTQPPDSLWNWFHKFLSDPEAFVPQSVPVASAAKKMTVGQMCQHLLTQLDWFSALFPRIPVAIQKDIDAKLREHGPPASVSDSKNHEDEEGPHEEEEEDQKRVRSRSRDKDAGKRHSPRDDDRYVNGSARNHRRDRDRDRDRERGMDRDRDRDRERDRNRDSDHRRHRSRSRSRDRRRSDRRSRSNDRSTHSSRHSDSHRRH